MRDKIPVAVRSTAKPPTFGFLAPPPPRGEATSRSSDHLCPGMHNPVARNTPLATVGYAAITSLPSTSRPRDPPPPCVTAHLSASMHRSRLALHRPTAALPTCCVLVKALTPWVSGLMQDALELLPPPWIPPSRRPNPTGTQVALASVLHGLPIATRRPLSRRTIMGPSLHATISR